MSNLREVNTKETEIFRGAKCFFSTGVLTMDDVSFINSSQDKTVVIMQNTKGQNPSVIGYLNPKMVLISVLGGLDYFKNTKYNVQKYIERTLFNPKELSSIIREFQRIENGINPNWGELEKAMYIYGILSKRIHYRRELDSGYGNGLDICWSLNGILYKNSNSAGYSMIFKELLDRNEIYAEYQSKAGDYAWNIMMINGKFYGVDLTRDAVNKTNYLHFGTLEANDFYSDSHRTVIDQETIIYPLSVFYKEEIFKAYDKINNKRTEIHMDVLKSYNTRDNQQYLIAHLGDIDNLSYYIDATNGIRSFYSPIGKLEELLTAENINNLPNSNLILGGGTIKESMPKFNNFVRSDGSSFVIFPQSANIEKGIKRYHLIERVMVGGRPMLRRMDVSSENDLEEVKDLETKTLIGDFLFGFGRLYSRVKYFGGYLGHISKETSKYFNL